MLSYRHGRIAAVAFALIASGAASVPGTALAQQRWPAKPLRLILPFPTGGADIMGRWVAIKLTDVLGQPVVIDPRPGAGGNIGAEIAAKSPPDGYTMVLCSPSLSISPSLYRKLNYDPIRDLTPVSLIANFGNVLVVHPSVPAKSLQELARLARSQPGRLSFGSGGVGSSNHLASELFKSLAKANVVHVPYKGASIAIVGLISGEVDMVISGIPGAVPFVKERKLRAVAVLQDKRADVLPDVPTARESGMPELTVVTWYGILAPTGTPREIVERLNTEIVKILKSPETIERFSAVGLDPSGSTPAAFGELIRQDTARWATVIKSAGIQAD